MSHSGFAQDPIYTQFYANKLYLNPAFAGYEPGMTTSLHHRKQWVPVGGEPAKFETNGVTASWEVGSPYFAGLGFLYNDHSEGTGLLKTQTYGFVYAARTRPCGKRFEGDWEFGFGLRGTYNRRGLDNNNLIFSDQLHPILGQIYGTQVPLEFLQPVEYMDLDAGILIDYRKDAHYLRFGLSTNHLLRRNISIIGSDDFLGPRLTVHGSYIREGSFLGEPVNFIGLMKLDYQRSSFSGNNYLGTFLKPGFWYKALDMGIAVELQEAPYLTGGVFLHHGVSHPIVRDTTGRNMNGISVVLGYEFPLEQGSTCTLTGSYQYDYSGLNSRSGGIWELSLILNWADGGLFKCDGQTTGSRKHRGPPCPRW